MGRVGSSGSCIGALVIAKDRGRFIHEKLAQGGHSTKEKEMARLSMVAPVLFCVALPALAAPKEGKRVAVANTAGATHQGVAKTVAKKSPAPANKAKASAKKVPVEVIPPPCFDEPVEIRRGKERARFALLDCQGNVASSALHQVSWMLRPSRGEWQVVDERLVSRLGSVAKKFRTPKAPLEFVIVSGERLFPKSADCRKPGRRRI